MATAFCSTHDATCYYFPMIQRFTLDSRNSNDRSRRRLQERRANDAAPLDETQRTSRTPRSSYVERYGDNPGGSSLRGSVTERYADDAHARISGRQVSRQAGAARRGESSYRSHGFDSERSSCIPSSRPSRDERLGGANRSRRSGVRTETFSGDSRSHRTASASQDDRYASRDTLRSSRATSSVSRSSRASLARDIYDERDYDYRHDPDYRDGVYDDPDPVSSRRSSRSSSRTQERRGLVDGDLFAAAERGRNSYAGGSGRGRGRLSFGAGGSLPMPFAAAIPVASLIAIIVLAVLIVGAFQSCTSGASDEPMQVEEQIVQPMAISYSPSIQAFDSVQDPGKTVSGFTLVTEGDSWTPTLDETSSSSLSSALSALADYDVGFVFTDLQSGAGLAYNIDQKVYGASSFKGPVFIYGCQQAIEPGNISMSAVNDNCEQAIVWSDNKSYYRMRNSFEGSANETLSTWLQNMNISTDLATDSSFPHYAARDSIKLWMNTYLYFNDANSDPDVVSWAQKFFSTTDTSMLRDGVTGKVTASSDSSTDSTSDDSSDSSSSTDTSSDAANTSSSSLQVITVYDKAGWINGSEDDALCDAGIIVEGDKAYLLSIMTGAPDSDANRASVAGLAQTLWNVRGLLEPPQGMVEASQ